MNAVAIMTPDPKNLAMKNTHGGSLMKEYLDDKRGRNAPKAELAMITKIAEIRAPSCSPSYSLSVEQVSLLLKNCSTIDLSAKLILKLFTVLQFMPIYVKCKK